MTYNNVEEFVEDKVIDETMGMRLQGREVFVVVSYDFEYVTEEGKEVWMKEGEVLLLLCKTNNDWWQVKIFQL